jgi:hypothetical protein
MTRSARRFRASLALAAALLAASAPVLAHAHLALGTQPGYAEVCTDRGLARMPTGDGHGGGDGLAAALAHCALCVAAGGDHALAGDVPKTLVAGLDAPPATPAADRGASADPVRAARPRGPPAGPVTIA